MFDLLIVGARCAGASLAVFMAKKGYKVCLIDHSIFPSDTLSTHIFGDWSLYQKLGIEDEVKNAGAPNIKRVRTDFDGCLVEGPLMMSSSILGLRRIKYDEILLNKATSYKNIEWHSQCKMIDVILENDLVVGVIVEENGKKHELRSKILIGADGRSSTVARILKSEKYHKIPSPRCAFYAYFTHVLPNPIPTFEFYWSGSDMILVHPCDEDLHCICILPPQNQFAHWIKQGKKNFLDKLSQVYTLDARMKNANLLNTVKGTENLESYLRIPYGNGWALVGDAGAAVHPCSGAGMDQAIATSEILSEYLHEYFTGKSTWKDSMTNYQHKRDQIVEKNFMAASVIGGLHGLTNEVRESVNLFCTLPQMTYKIANKIPDLIKNG